MRAGGGSAKARSAEGASAGSTEKRKVTEPGAAAGKEKKKVAISEPIADPGPPAPKVEYRALYDVPECPVFHPTAKEFNHPGKYIESISEQVRLLLPHQAELCAQCGPDKLTVPLPNRRSGPLASAKSCRLPRGSRRS